ncbi:globin family protein [Anthocerotibacter panamensis]|uniref:ApcA1 n=1 Tax=Anthocerotibacter panamensis TaxID=2857077 RepID=A0AAJ6N6F0_9CYAN|nr:allophycocyanin [Anthocerotibacter panamensis]8IMK_A Chain A, ApcA1 [Anthocerotibacter panamensis]8IMK_C Chain C, ApcA1 [Anthocerotibacter panamensis]8IMK_E Chain E, ApcA1 [Anthocerotibacter panamensis]8IMK_N Chain N, ApcA1 [Anthocerotibacter panamensis]8IMK_O Chain O, ApcA1 [Anthocerotibacter panamensis]8IMK_P Chain P, ApcA1 [Anthocerotibacter panamensis]8IMK_Q Chain Q, ApcA1 [Anthocerotibacter panamensis]8IMK_R Chain R, ApcA1 [Anthocerotibacter panamensis]8IMK_S Chain S, ApcA1 [Anthoc
MSAITKAILNADAEARYLSPGEIDVVRGYLASGERRVRVARVLSDNALRIVRGAGDTMFQKRPDLVAPGGNAYGEVRTAKCLRDLDYFLRLVTYGVLAGDTSPIDEIGLIGIKETYSLLEVPVPGVIDGIKAAKQQAAALLSSEDAAEASFYFDYVISAMS